VRLKYDNDREKIKNSFFKLFNNLDDLKDYALSTNEQEILSKIKVSMSVPKLSTELWNLKQRTVMKEEDAAVILTTAHLK